MKSNQTAVSVSIAVKINFKSVRNIRDEAMPKNVIVATNKIPHRKEIIIPIIEAMKMMIIREIIKNANINFIPIISDGLPVQISTPWSGLGQLI
ncbi:MAG: hypothetical protein LBF54_04570 [Holosporaceae bacterium]|nr:hypothetical protein [Holosporaceae bacterium]